MTRLITNIEQIAWLLPNAIVTVDGEPDMFDKLESFIAMAEDDVVNSLCGPTLMEEAAGQTAPRQQWAVEIGRVVAAEAMRSAIPSLDVVATPNGFGVVSDQNIAPASPERVRRLTEELAKAADGARIRFVCELHDNPDLLRNVKLSEFPARLLRDCIFPDMMEVEVAARKRSGEVGGSIWNHFKMRMTECAKATRRLASEALGEQAVSVLCRAAVRPEEYTQEIVAATYTAAEVVSQCADGGMLLSDTTSRLFNSLKSILENDESSEQASKTRMELSMLKYSPMWRMNKDNKRFENKKEDGGFFL